MLKATIVVGNPKPKSRTLQIAESVALQVFGKTDVDLRTIDLADHVGELFAWPSATLEEATGRVAGSDFVIFACPTYKANYTGLLKAFLDRYPANGLKGVAAAALMTGADFQHSMAPTFTLIPLLLELGASVPCKGLYFNTSQMDKVDELVVNGARDILASFNLVSSLAGRMGMRATSTATAG